jgi:hypothetical protein
MRAPDSIDGRRVIAYAHVPAAERDVHVYKDIPSGDEHRIELFVLAHETDAEWHVTDEDGTQRIQTEAWWVYELDGDGLVINEDPWLSLTEALGRPSGLDWKFID